MCDTQLKINKVFKTCFFLNTKTVKGLVLEIVTKKDRTNHSLLTFCVIPNMNLPYLAINEVFKTYFVSNTRS